MALEALAWKNPTHFSHQPKHDLESLFYDLLTICTYVEEPGHLRSPIPVDGDESICMNDWWTTYDRHLLARWKASQISHLLSRFPPYWNDLHQAIRELYQAIWEKDGIAIDQRNVATPDAFLNILTKARDTQSVVSASGSRPRSSHAGVRRSGRRPATVTSSQVVNDK